MPRSRTGAWWIGFAFAALLLPGCGGGQSSATRTCPSVGQGVSALPELGTASRRLQRMGYRLTGTEPETGTFYTATKSSCHRLTAVFKKPHSTIAVYLATFEDQAALDRGSTESLVAAEQLGFKGPARQGAGWYMSQPLIYPRLQRDLVIWQEAGGRLVLLLRSDTTPPRPSSAAALLSGFAGH